VANGAEIVPGFESLPVVATKNSAPTAGVDGVGGAGGGVTVTVNADVALAEPLPLAVSVYVVVAPGATTVLELPVTSPTPGSIRTDVAPLTDQVRVVD
jgi:hypothetical protein